MIRAVLAGLAVAAVILLALAGTYFRSDSLRDVVVAEASAPPPPVTTTEAVATAPFTAQVPPTETASAPAAEVSAPKPEAEVAEPKVAATRILVSISKRRLWYVKAGDTLLAAPVAIGMGKDFTYNGKKYHFSTPRGTRRVLSKVKDPVWIVPEWHYYEKAAKLGHEAVKLEKDGVVKLSDGSLLVVQEDQVGRINEFGNFAPILPGNEVIFDDKLFIPPEHTLQRRVPDALGPYKLDMGNGYLIHGTHVYNEESIGQAVSHGCVRMRNADLERLYKLVPAGTVVEIF
jgi:lipoprotein-anchoring transpeptidase ErfK/SrfK